MGTKNTKSWQLREEAKQIELELKIFLHMINKIKEELKKDDK